MLKFLLRAMAIWAETEQPTAAPKNHGRYQENRKLKEKQDSAKKNLERKEVVIIQGGCQTLEELNFKFVANYTQWLRWQQQQHTCLT